MRMDAASLIPYQLKFSNYYLSCSDILGLPVDEAPYTYGEEIDHRFGVSDGYCITDDMAMGFCNLHNDHQLLFEAAGSSSSSAGAAAGAGLLMPIIPNISSAFPIAHHDYNLLGIEGKHELEANIEDHYNELKVGRYSVEERKERILRYLKKRNQRNFNKTIKYACRKTLAEKRVRIRGRFAKNNINNIIEPSHEDHIDQASKTFEDHQYSNYQHNYNNSFYQHFDSFQILYDEDEALQAAMDNLVHLPYK